MNQNLNYDDDDLTLGIESTWLESNGCGYDRVIILNYFCVDCFMSDGESLFRTVGQALRDRIEAKLSRDLGLVHRRDYIFGVYDNPVMKDGVWIQRPIPGDLRTIVRLKEEEHFVMFKMHYSDN